MLKTTIDYKIIGERIKNKRKELNFTQENLASSLDISTFYLSKIENGKCSPTLETLALIASHLDMDLAELITGTSTLEEDYYNNQFSDIISKATDKQLDLILKLAKTVIEG